MTLKQRTLVLVDGEQGHEIYAAWGSCYHLLQEYAARFLGEFCYDAASDEGARILWEDT
jgi:hypothetical protein